jgi:hypothetical protein
MMARLPFPPRWAEAILHRWLAARDRYTITGDLLEEYREEILPERGGFRAALWYWWQTATLLALMRKQRRRVDMNRRTSTLWLLAGITWTAMIAGLLIHSKFTPPALPMGALVVPLALAISALTSLRSRDNVRLLWSAGRVWTSALIVAAGVHLVADMVFQFDPERYLLAQAKPGFSEVDFPSRFLFEIAVGLIVIAAGFHGTWKSGQVRAGIAVAVVSGTAVVLPLFLMELIGGEGWAAGRVLLAASGIGSVLGAAGAFLGRGFRAIPTKTFAIAVVTVFGLAACSRTGTISSGTQQAIEAMHFDPSKPISVTGVITTLYLPPQGSGLILVKADEGGYIFRLGGVRATAKGGMTRFNTHPGERVVVTGLPASEGKQIDGVSVAQASTVKTLDGRTVYDRSRVE